MRKNFFKFGLGSIVAVGIVSATLLSNTASPIEDPSASKTDKGSISKTDETEDPSDLISDFVVPAEFLPKVQSYEINPAVKTDLKIGKKGTVLHIPKSAFVDDEGKVVTSPVTITYQEYKDAADMAFSGIPMTYTKGTTEYNFNSSGMFTIEGYADGKPVNIAPNIPLSIDYALAKQNANIDFYKLKEDGSNWDFMEEIDEKVFTENPPDSVPNNNYTSATGIKSAPVAPQIVQRINEPVSGSPTNPGGQRIPPNGTANPGFASPESLTPTDSMFQWNANYGIDFGICVTDGVGSSTGRTPAPLQAGIAGHSYPAIINGLRLTGFGTYNSDQIGRVANRTSINPKFVDESGAVIKGQKMMSLIDLNFNAAFSFGVKHFICNNKGNNVILLYTYSGDLYLLEKGKFATMNIQGHGKQTFRMKNVTETMKNSNDLRAYLGL